MSGTNGNGNGHGENTVKNAVTVATMPGRNGGTLRRGGISKAGPGRSRKEVREMLVREFQAQVPLLKAEVTKGRLSRKDYADMCAKYGLGTTITETDTEGNDVHIHVTREPRRLVGND